VDLYSGMEQTRGTFIKGVNLGKINFETSVMRKRGANFGGNMLVAWILRQNNKY